MYHPHKTSVLLHSPVALSVAGVVGISSQVTFFEITGGLVVAYSLLKIATASTHLKP